MSDYVLNDGIEDADENDAFERLSGRQGIIYLIDAGKYTNNPDKSIVENNDQLRSCLNCIEADLLKNILVYPKSLVSVVFYNTVHSPKPSTTFIDDEGVNTLVPPNCALFIPLTPISKEVIQYFKNFKESEDLFDFDGKYGSSDASSFSEALWLCSRLIIQSNYKLVSSEIVLCTNNELPHPNGSKEQQQAIERAKDLRENYVTIYMLPMVDEFDFEPFYKEFICEVYGQNEEEFHCDSPQQQRYRLLNRVQRANHQKSCLRHLNFELTDGVAMACDIYSLTRTAKKPGTVKMFRSTNEIVVGKRSYYVEGQNQNVDEQNPDDDVEMEPRKVLPGELYKSQVVSGEEVIFRPDEFIKMKSMQNPGLRLLGFKPLEELQPRWMLKHCLFLYPNEKKTTGSTVLFRTLWEKCMEKQKYALCTLTMRRGTLPKYVALVGTQTEDVNDNIIHHGFHVIYLPNFESNISVLDSVLVPLNTPRPSQVELMERICKKLRFKYHHNLFANPMLASFYTNLEALVYDEEVEEAKDVTLPPCDDQDKKLSEFVDDIAEEFGTDPIAGASKRANAGDGDAGGRAKASKKDLSPNDVEQAIRNGRMEAITVQHLKDFLRNNNSQAPSSATKKVLFDLAQKLVN